jgi:hypothetical protein
VYDYSYFKRGQELLEDRPDSGRPSTYAEAISKVKQLVHADQCITISEFASEVGYLV